MTALLKIDTAYKRKCHTGGLDIDFLRKTFGAAVTLEREAENRAQLWNSPALDAQL